METNKFRHNKLNPSDKTSKVSHLNAERKPLDNYLPTLLLKLFGGETFIEIDKGFEAVVVGQC